MPKANVGGLANGKDDKSRKTAKLQLCERM